MTRPAYAISVELSPNSSRIWRAILRPAGGRVRVACGLSPREAGLRVLKLWRKDERAYQRFLSVSGLVEQTA